MNIIELKKGGVPHPKLIYRYKTHQHYALRLKKTTKGWRAKLQLRPLPQEVEKSCESELFQWMVQEPRAFAAVEDGKEVGWIEIDLNAFKDRTRAWEFLVQKEYQRRGIGTALMRKAEEVAREAGSRMLVLETQSCNVGAIAFYLGFGFDLVGFDGTAYSNEDVERGEIRLELGKLLNK
jgi:ribosomal protein S18 acetylase RimI-like enzyme